jgi:hypothetical protein
MGHAVPKPSDMFSDATDAVQVAQRFEQYKGALTDEHTKAAAGGRGFAPGVGIVEDPGAKSKAIASRVEAISKSIGPDVLASVQGEIDALNSALSADIGKDWSLPGTDPNNATLVPYDLEAPAKLLVPRLTPLRNSLPRGKGQGTARQFRVVDGWSNSGIGGVADKSPFMDSQSDVGVPTFGSLELRRGQKIEYASHDESVAYVEMSLSDQVNWVSQFAGQGYQDIRSLSQTALLWSHLGGEERAILYGRGPSANGYSGAVSAPVISSETATTGGSIAAGTYPVVVTAKTGFGESVISNNTAQVTTGAASTITVTVTSAPVGALGFNLYVGTAGGAVGTAKFQTSFSGNTVTVTSLTTTGATNPGTTDSSVQARGYDGFLTVQSDPDRTGYFKNLNAALTDTTPGAEFQDAFLSLYQSVKADPDNIWVDGGTARNLGNLLQTAQGSSSYRLQLNGDGHGHFLGSVVTGIENQVTRKMVPFNVHPWMPEGCALIRSETLPIPDSNVSATAQVISVQEYMSVDWPVVQFTYDASTYWYGTMVHYAPKWSGLITGIESA